MIQDIKIYLTDETCDTLGKNSWLLGNPNIFQKEKRISDWQAEFCHSIDYSSPTIPWNLVRAKEFELSDNIKTIACCDPISIQMTHRGAYCWGQQKLNLSHQDALIIVAKINEVLMDEGEQFLLLDNFKWLFVSEKALCLEEKSFEHLIGKDLFEFKYQKNDSKKWHCLATEIQMLITQLIDYGQLSLEAKDQESTIAVHFWGSSNSTLEHMGDRSNLAAIRTKEIYLSNTMMMKFLSYIGHQPKQTASLRDEIESNRFCQESSKKDIIIVDERLSDRITNLLSYFLIDNNFRHKAKVKIITQNGSFQHRVSSNWFWSFIKNMRKRVISWS